MRTVAIVGVGLIGGSFGLALRKAGFQGRIYGVSSERSVAEGMRVGAIDCGAPLEEAGAKADLIFLSQPIFGILETIGKLDGIVRRDALVTDAGSTKSVIAKEAARHLKGCAFVGGHPMAGKESRGAGAADADLFRGRTWVLTERLDHPVARVFQKWIALFGAHEVILDPVMHDRLVAWGSHLPQLASTGLAAALQDCASDAASIAGPGLLDMTRLAMSSWELWSDILETNQNEVGAALDGYIKALEELRADFAGGFARGAAFASRLRGRMESD